MRKRKMQRILRNADKHIAWVQDHILIIVLITLISTYAFIACK